MRSLDDRLVAIEEARVAETRPPAPDGAALTPVPARDDDFGTFVDAASSRLLWTARMLCDGDSHAAEDLVQEALLEVHRRWHEVREPAARVAYARRIVVRRASRRWGSRLRRSEVPTDAPPEMPTDPIDARADVLALRTAVQGLSPRQRAVVVLRYWEGLDEAGIAAAIGCSRGSVKTHASRAMQHLQRHLDSDGGPR